MGIVGSVTSACRIDKTDTDGSEAARARSEERLRLAEAASGIGTFEMDLAIGQLGMEPAGRRAVRHRSRQWATVLRRPGNRLIFVDDVPKIHAAFDDAPKTGSVHVEFRVRHPDGSLHWIAAKGRRLKTGLPSFRGALFDITERKALEARLLALNETLRPAWRRCAKKRARWKCSIGPGVAVAAEHDLERLVQMVTDAGVELSHARVRRILLQRHQGRRRSLYALHAFRRAAQRLREISDAAQHGHLRADLPRPRAGPLRRYS